MWSKQITNNMQGMEIDGLYGLGSKCVYWVDKMTGFSLLSLAFALLSPPSLELAEHSLSVSYSDSPLLCFPLSFFLVLSLSLCIIFPLSFSTSLCISIVLPLAVCVSHSFSPSLPLLSFSLHLSLNAADQSVR